MSSLFPHTRKSAVSALLVLVLFAWAQTANAEGISLNQCANGGISDAVDHLQCYDGWISGNLTQSKAAYAENNFVPFRVHLTGLDIGEKYTYSFSWDILKSGKHAIDYIGSYDHSVSSADACDGALAPCPGTPDTIAIPPDPDVTLHIDFVPALQLPGNFTLFGGTFDAVGAYFTVGTDARGISVEFTPTQDEVVLAWGGHISSPFDWGEGNTASGISGSPYHTSNISLDLDGDAVAGGKQDVSLSAAAVFRPSTVNVTKTANKDDTFYFTSVQGAIPMPPDGETNPWTLITGQSKDVSAPGGGDVTITESLLPAGPWSLKSIVCSELGSEPFFSYDADTDDPTDSVVFNVGESQTIFCTFDNEFSGAPVLSVIKKVIADDATCTDAIRDSNDYESLSIHSGEQVKYCFWVTNTGDDPALDISLSDDLGNEFGIPADIPLSGGSNLDGDADAPDLIVGTNWVQGELLVAINVALNTTVTNVVTASGTGEFDGQLYTDKDDASVTTDLSSSCTLVASVYSGAGPCAGTPQVDVLAGSAVHWCGKATWDNGAVLDLTGIQVDLLTPILSNNTESDMSPAETRDIAVGSAVANSDFTGTVKLTGSEGGLNAIACQGQATVNVVTPGIKLTKTISTTGSCTGSESNQASIISGDPVWYCFEIENTGDEPLTNAKLSDAKIGIANFDAGNFIVGQVKTFPAFSGGNPTVGYSNTATVVATEPKTGSTVTEDSTATLTVRSADVSVNKSVDSGNIVICGPNSLVPSEFCSEPNLDGLFDATYTIVVTNNGPSEATGVVVSDTLPTGFLYNSYDATGGVTCDDINLPEFDCEIGGMDPAASVTINIYGAINPAAFEFPWTTVNNQACANTTPANLDSDHSNNCDSAKTTLGTGATRTIGWWSTHPDGLNACLNASGGAINLGFLTIRDETGVGLDGNVDATISTDPNAKGKSKSSLMTALFVGNYDNTSSTATVMAKGMMNATVAHWGDKTQRSHIGQARVKAAKQLTAAWCNETLFGSVFGNFLGGWDAIYQIMAGQAYMDGDTLIDCDVACTKQAMNAVIQSINVVGGAADLFNNSGDDLEIPFPAGPADPHAQENDPTDPAD